VIFSRNRGSGRHAKDDARGARPEESFDDLKDLDDLDDLDGDGSSGRPERADGPYDVTEAPEGIAQLDLGALKVPAVEGVEVRVQADNDGKIQQIVLVFEESALQLGVFAAPRSEGIWDEVRAEIAAAMKSDGAAPQEFDGPYGVELAARVNTPEGPADVRFVGVDGPRWMVRALFQGLAAADPGQEGVLGDCLRGLVVVRDDEARPVREALPLRLPREMAEHAEEHAADGEDPTPPDVAVNEQFPGANGRHAH
jgi:hypothetical protein